MAPLERDAMTLNLAAFRIALTGGAVKYLLIVCAVVGAVTLTVNSSRIVGLSTFVIAR